MKRNAKARALLCIAFASCCALVCAGVAATRATASVDSATASPPATPSPLASAGSDPCAKQATPLGLEDAQWLVQVVTSGGLLYRHTDAIVRSDGALWADGCALTLAPQALARITAAVAAANETAWKSSYTPQDTCCDQIATSLRLLRKGGPANGYASSAISSTIAGSAPGFFALVRAVESETYGYTAFARRMRQIATPSASPSPVPTASS